VGTALASGLLAITPGLGLGHAVAGEWQESGWRFTLGEGASIGAFVYGLSLCECVSVDHGGEEREGSAFGAPLALVGFGAFATLRVMEIVDLFQRLKARGAPPESPNPTETGFLAPQPQLLPGGAGVTIEAAF
jgi:hypothetical protein